MTSSSCGCHWHTSLAPVLIAAQLQIGFVTAVDGRVPKIVENLPVVKPTFMGAVPRIFEKVYAGVNAQVAADGGARRRSPRGHSVSVRSTAMLSSRTARHRVVCSAPSWASPTSWCFRRCAIALVARSACSSQALQRCHPTLLNGSTSSACRSLRVRTHRETSAATAIVRPDNIKFGTVGEAVPGTEVKIAEDGEILVKGDGVMRGYHNNPEATAEVFVGDGYFATGDIGEIDALGRIKITDRRRTGEDLRWKVHRSVGDREPVQGDLWCCRTDGCSCKQP